MPERYSVTIKDLPTDERPRERLMHFGPRALSMSELLAIVLRTGTKERSAIALAEQLLADHKNIRGVANASVQELARLKGVGPVKAVQIAACVELGRRLASYSDDERPTIRSPEEAVHLLMPELRDAPREKLVGLFLDSRSRVIRKSLISQGTIESSVVHPREVFREAIAAGASSVIVAHNHPSGDPAPSPEDRNVTLRLLEAGRIIGIELVDHIIIGDGRWVSLQERGILK